MRDLLARCQASHHKIARTMTCSQMRDLPIFSMFLLQLHHIDPATTKHHFKMSLLEQLAAARQAEADLEYHYERYHECSKRYREQYPKRNSVVER